MRIKLFPWKKNDKSLQTFFIRESIFIYDWNFFDCKEIYLLKYFHFRISEWRFSSFMIIVENYLNP